MANITEESVRKETLLETAKKIMTAARTAPKGRGIDTLSISVVTGSELQQIIDKMKEIGKKEGSEFFIRDAENLLASGILILIGTQIAPTNLHYCGLCGFDNCSTKTNVPEAPCAFNLLNLGIALGSAVSLAADLRVDNRIMYSAGKAAMEIGIVDKNIKVCMGIPLSVTSKSPFFDRK